jgi:hypothetical protein
MRDIPYMSKFGPYTIARANENVQQAAFDMLHCMCEKQNFALVGTASAITSGQST